MPRVGVQGKEEAPGGASPFRGRGGVSRWFFPFACLKIKNSSPDVSCASGPICLDDRVSSRSVEINKHRETTSNNRRHAAGRAGGGEPPPATAKHFGFQLVLRSGPADRPPACPAKPGPSSCPPHRHPDTFGCDRNFLPVYTPSLTPQACGKHTGCAWRGHGPTGTPAVRSWPPTSTHHRVTGPWLAAE